ncbi:tRNA (adenosine(37)-N6)-threonylcarbamoyltransferase complex dimerization subunit type 1 TsaB [Bifidobacterium felsineum]|uniref:tRNA (Adenosine(37)-N6)-threonylcarbamoyltransferase complex dimerization subunit type 1 TsaB n=1 Tax=Bifidobacterium felsineum TaxID=2045440 RepID=A0A2M9HK33_9BIFI|nr:tRNA (adenosine(37)-N6)-threonylcarbamoyltransferase complex dimerization subunit type 1 TsaB [Bifidobacterium felsineum]MBT1165046.1 tRNA (adenosine(37)-N6)-threonylcarbamoyltransferase complex dimerization subunit type 1 TsaB [Bifidobacterium felsineum]PJM77157.1 tRNA (adenosine(37)-N6)-threonylcarbamoyltransferase complex dimerization subunit type 1 TsaB [Bifidobacterium felsineum]
MGCTLVIDTSFGSTVGVVGHKPIVETDSRTHVEKLQVNIARAVNEAGYQPSDISTIVAGVGPAPFTGLRAGIVAAKALAFATGAKLLGQNVLEPQAQWNLIRRGKAGTLGDSCDLHVLTLAVNDARRKQLYFELCAVPLTGEKTDGTMLAEPLIAMDIDYPESIVERVNQAAREYQQAVAGHIVVDVVGHGAHKYASILEHIEHLGDIEESSVLDQGEQGLSIFASEALLNAERKPDALVEPLYLRRPDAEIPAPLKHVLGHEGAERTN